MPRKPRIVIDNYPHHIVQRGNRRSNVFFDDQDRICYLKMLNKYFKKYEIELLAYCLMTNHVHLIVAPRKANDLAKALSILHRRYAQMINVRNGWTGHLWQQRFFSSVLDDSYMWTAIKYTEQNPYKAKMVSDPCDYRWSSARAHCGLTEDCYLTSDIDWINRLNEVTDWHSWLMEQEPKENISSLCKNTEKDYPSGADDFINHLEIILKKSIKSKKVGRPKKDEK